MSNMYPHLLAPKTVRGHVFKNRILCGPLGYNQKNLTASMSQDNIDYYGALARGGTARVVTGDCMVSPDARYGPQDGGRPQYYAPPMEIMDSIKTYVHTIHQYNCQAFVQLGHNGGDYHPFGDAKSVTYGPTGVEFPNGGRVIEMDRAKMDEVIGEFVRCVTTLRMGGIDGILIHGGHGSKIIDEFRSPLHNQRTDEYGGSVENRCRFPMELMRAVRKAAGPDVVVELRFSASEYCEGGLTVDDSIVFLKMLEAEDLVDIFHVSGGMHFAPRYNAFLTSPATFPPALFRENCKKIKAAGIKTPLAIVNSMADPDIGEDVLSSGDADFVVLARQINLADPYYPRKLREGKPWLIDNCLRCHGCFDVVGPCSVNPHATFKTYESSYRLPKSDYPRKVCIVGGGIGGMKAAFTAAERGHHVILFEKEDRLGGQLRFADTDSFKMDIRRYKNNMIRRCEEHPNIEIRLNTAVTPESIQAELPCALIVAIGGVQRMPNIPGIDRPNVLSIMDAYLRPEKLGSDIIMLGSGLTACEVGFHLERTGRHVSVIGRRERICYHEDFHVLPTAIFSPVGTFMDWFRERNADLYLNTDVVAIVDGGVKVRDVVTGEERVIPGDTVVIAAGTEDQREAAYAFNDVGAEYFAVAGDCLKPHKIRDAVSQGYWAAMEL